MRQLFFGRSLRRFRSSKHTNGDAQIIGRERRERVSQLAGCGGWCLDSRRRVNSDVGFLSITKMKRIAIISLSSTLLLIFCGRASACWCRREPLTTDAEIKRNIRQSLKDSKIVFSGKVVEKSTTALKFQVRALWKGTTSNEITFTSQNYLLQTNENGVEHFIWDCAYSFDVGQEYLVYAQTIQGQLEVSKCSRTQFLDSAAHDVTELDRLTKRRTKSTALSRPRRNPTNRWTRAAGACFAS